MVSVQLWNFHLFLAPGVKTILGNGEISMVLNAGGNELDIAVESSNAVWNIKLQCKLQVKTGKFNELQLLKLLQSDITNFSIKGINAPIKYHLELVNGRLLVISDQKPNEIFNLLPGSPSETLRQHILPSGIDKNSLTLMTALGFDITDGFSVLFYIVQNPGLNNVTVNEDLISSFATIFSHDIEQRLAATSLALRENNSNGFLQINFEPSNTAKGSFFYINPYIYDVALDTNNLSAYQYALVNGSLQYDYLLNSWYWTNGHVLLLNYSDQNSNPLVISLTRQLKENSQTRIQFKRFKIEYRHGNRNVDDVNNQDDFQNLTPGLVLEQEKKEDVYPVISIRPRSIDNDLKNKQLYNIKHTEDEVLNILNRPYWMAADGRVKIADVSPAEFYGLVKGTIYKPVHPSADVNVSIQSESIKGFDNLSIYHATHLEFQFSEIELHNLVEEKESFEGASPATFTRNFTKTIKTDADRIRVPASNYKIAAANVIDPKAGNTTITKISAGVGEWINTLQDDLHAFEADNKDIIHESGFRRNKSLLEKSVPKEFFSKAPHRSNNFADTIPINLNLVHDDKAASFAHGTTSGNSDPFSNLSKTKSNKDHLEALQELQDLPIEKILQLLRKTKRYWNQASTYATQLNNKKAKAFQTVKYYLQKGPSALLSSTFDEKEIFNIRQELKQFTQKPKELINELQLMVSGNLNSINGLGSRVKLVRNKIMNWKEADLKKAWEMKWEEAVKRPADQVIAELLNYYYYPLDRKATTEMAKLKRLLDQPELNEEEKKIKAKLLALIGGETSVEEMFSDIETIITNEIIDLDPTKDAGIEIQKLLSDAWLGVDQYIVQLEEMWKLVLLSVEEFEKLKQDLKVIVESNDFNTWEGAEPRIRRFFSSVLTNWTAVRTDAKKLWDQFNGDRVELTKELADLYFKLHKDFLTKLDKFRSKYGPYYNPLSYKKIIEDIAKQVASDEINFIRAAFKERVLGVIEDQLIAILSKEISSYEEDIVHLARLVNTWTKDLQQANQHLENVIKATKQDAAARLKALRHQYNAGYLALQETIASMTDTVLEETDAQIEKFINENWETFEDIQRLVVKIRKADSVLNKLVKDFNELDGKFEDILDKLKDPATAREFIIDYLLKKYNLNINIEDLRIDPPEYVVYGKNVAYNVDPSIVNTYNAVVEKLFASKFTLSSFGKGKKWNMVKGESAVFIIKLGNHLTIKEIIEDIEKNNLKAGGKSPFGWDDVSRKEFFDKDLNRLSELNTKLWRGIFIVNPLADISKDEFLNTLLGMSHFRMPFAAIGGKGLDTDLNDLNVYARIRDQKTVAEAKEKKDVNFTVISFDATIKNTKLVEGTVVTQLDIRKILGKEYEEDKVPQVEITGTIPPQKPGEDAPGFEFAAKLKHPLRVDMNFAFFKEINISRIRAANKQNKCYLEIDATVSFKSFMESAGLENVSLKNFRIEIPVIPGGSSMKLGVPRALNFDLDAIEFLLKDPKPLSLLAMELLPKGIGFLKDYKKVSDPQRGEKDFPGYIWLMNPPEDKGQVAYVKLDIDFGNLTSLGSTDGQSLKLSGVMGYTVKGGQTENKIHFGINGGQFTNIDINLFRFIELKIRELAIVNDVTLNDGSKASVIYAKEAELKLLNWSVLGENGKANFMLMNESAGANRKGFYFLYKNDKPDPDGVLKIFWILISRGIWMQSDKLTALLSLSNLEADPRENVKDIPEASKIEVDPVNEFKQLAFTDDNNWMLGASFAIGDIFDRCAFILHDKHYYGIMMASKQEWFKALFQTDKIALAYIPGRTKKEDRFRIEMPLPFLNFFGTLKSGLFALEIGVNKDFLFDLGYPWRVGNRYEWPRAFSSIQGIYELKFGVYFEKRTEYTPENNNIVTIGAGIGLYYGYHVGGRTPIAWAEAGIGLFIILAGQAKFLMKKELTSPFSLLNASLVEITVTGVIGIYAYAEGGVNYWVISASFRAEIQAAISGTLIYRPHGDSALFYEAMLSARFSASARIKLGFVRVTVSISGSVSLHVGGKIALN